MKISVSFYDGCNKDTPSSIICAECAPAEGYNALQIGRLTLKMGRWRLQWGYCHENLFDNTYRYVEWMAIYGIRGFGEWTVDGDELGGLRK